MYPWLLRTPRPICGPLRAVLTLALMLAGCKDPTVEPPASVAVQAEPPSLPLAPGKREPESCAGLEARIRQDTAQPGTPELDARRIRLLARAKAEPVLFLRPPEFEPTADVSIRRLRASLLRAPYPGDRLKLILPAFRLHPERGRKVLLREGYLYAEDPELAFALVDQVRVEHLFDTEEVWLTRGDQSYRAARQPSGSYRYLSGPEEGKPVRLILFDRVGIGPVPEPLHRDLRSLRNQLHFDSMKIEHATERHLIAELRYGPFAVLSVLSSDAARLTLECERAEGLLARDLALFRDRGLRQLSSVTALHRVIQKELEEQIPFDEPYYEQGQQDGMLREKWLSYYRLGETKFSMNGHTYSMFDGQGRPIVPQVCVDFITDTLERASGTWWFPRGQEPGRLRGKLDFTEHSGSLRKVPAFVELARSRPEWFDVYETPPAERIQFRNRDSFYASLSEHPERFIPGDIVVIRGYTPFEKQWQTRVMHYHTFFIYETDPLTGFPFALAGNAGVPTIRVWETEVRRTPKRSIWFRIRPKLHFMETHFDRSGPPTEPAPLSVGPS